MPTNDVPPVIPNANPAAPAPQDTPPAELSPELLAATKELDIWTTVFSAMANAQIRASEWPKGQAVLDRLDVEVRRAQAAADAIRAKEDAARPALSTVKS